MGGGGGVAFPVGRSHGTGWWCVMGGFQTFYGCCSKSGEWMLLGIYKALVKNVCSADVTRYFASGLLVPVFGVCAIVGQWLVAACCYSSMVLLWPAGGGKGVPVGW